MEPAARLTGSVLYKPLDPAATPMVVRATIVVCFVLAVLAPKMRGCFASLCKYPVAWFGVTVLLVFHLLVNNIAFENAVLDAANLLGAQLPDHVLPLIDHNEVAMWIALALALIVYFAAESQREPKQSHEQQRKTLNQEQQNQVQQLKQRVQQWEAHWKAHCADLQRQFEQRGGGGAGLLSAQ